MAHLTTHTDPVSPAVSFVPGVLNVTPVPVAALYPAPLFAVSAVAAPAAVPDVLYVVPAPVATLDLASVFTECAVAAPTAPVFADVLF